MKQLKFLIFALSALILGYFSYQTATARPPLGVTNFDSVHLRCVDCATATPALLVDQASGSGGGSVSEWRIDATPVLQAPRSGGFALTVPTAVATGVPALVVNNRGAGNNALEVRKNATPVFTISNSGGLTSSDGNLTIADFTRIVPQTSITLTDAGVLTPTGSYQPVTAAGNVTVTLATSGISSGMWLVIQNQANVTVVITDASTTKGSGNLSMGEDDSATLIFDGTDWIQLGESDN
jgi:hypothetical protein